MAPDELAGIQEAFGKSLEPMVTELREIRSELAEHSKLLRNIDGRLVRVEGLLDGVEICDRAYTSALSSIAPPFFRSPPAAASRYASMKPPRSPSSTASTFDCS